MASLREEFSFWSIKEKSNILCFLAYLGIWNKVMKVHDIASVVRAGEVGFHSDNEFNRFYTQKHTIVR